MALPSGAVMPGPAAEAEAKVAAVGAAGAAPQQCYAAWSADSQEGCILQEFRPGSQRADLKRSHTYAWAQLRVSTAFPAGKRAHS